MSRIDMLVNDEKVGNKVLTSIWISLYLISVDGGIRILDFEPGFEKLVKAISAVNPGFQIYFGCCSDFESGARDIKKQLEDAIDDLAESDLIVRSRAFLYITERGYQFLEEFGSCVGRNIGGIEFPPFVEGG